jgi:hypothetical protein
VSFTAITLCVASQRVFIAVSVYFVIDSVRKFLDTTSYFFCRHFYGVSSYEISQSRRFSNFNGCIASDKMAR